METIKRTVLVTIKKEIEVEFPAHFDTKEFLADWCNCLMDIASVDELFIYAARMAAYYPDGYQDESFGLIGDAENTHPKVPDTKCKVISDKHETEILKGGTPC